MTDPREPVAVDDPLGSAGRRDIALRDAVQRQLDAHPERDLRRVGVGVEDGVVTLVGTVASDEERLAAGAVARRAAGDARVVDLLLVGGEHAAIEQTEAAERSSRRGSSRGVSPQESGMVPSAEDPAGPWGRGLGDDEEGADL